MENTDADEEFGTQSPIIDVKEQRRKKDRDRYARMTNEEKQEKLKRRREAYQQSKTIRDLTQLPKKCTWGRKKYADLKPEQKTKKCVREKQKYANMQPEQKKARIEQIIANREFRRNTPCKESIAMVNPAYVESEEEVSRKKRID